VAGAPAAAQWNDAGGGERRVQCISNPNGENFCALDGNTGPVRLLRSFGPNACVEGSTWRYDQRGLHVRNGCRGEFAYRAGGGGWQDSTVEVRCSSNDGREQFCAADNRGVTLRKTESRAPCVQGESWRSDRRGIYVRNGCRGVFVARTGGGGGNDGGWQGGGGYAPIQIKCQSIGGRWGACPVDIDGPVRLVKKESRADCVRGWTWGILNREAIWVSEGCRAIFEVQNGRAASGRRNYEGKGSAPPGIRARRKNSVGPAQPVAAVVAARARAPSQPWASTAAITIAAPR
jgi:hypothetical protein